MAGISEETSQRVDDLLVALSTAGHGDEERARIRATIDAIATTANVSGSVLARSREEALRVALAVAMRRRNHALSMAAGDGAGERDLLREALSAAREHDPSAVARLLPLVPAYSSWREMRVLGERWLNDAVQAGAFPGPPVAGGGSTSGGGGEQPKLPPEVAEVCRLFGEQLSRDKALLDDGHAKQDLDGDKDKKGKRKALPSNAAKYAPHPNRHSGSGGSGKRKADKPEQDGSPRKKHKARAAPKASDSAKLRWLCKKLANAVAEHVFGGDRPTLQADYRRLRASLNRCLTEEGHLVEPLLPPKRLKEINFKAAPSGSLKKYSKAIKRDPEAMALWRRAIATSDRAVPDLENLFQDTEAWLEEDSVMQELMPRAVDKAIKAAQEERAKLQRSVASLLEQLGATSEGTEELLEDSTVLVAVSTSGASATQRRALLLAALLVARVQGAVSIAVDGEVVEVPSEESGLGLLGSSAAAETEGAKDADGCGPSGGPAAPLPGQALERGARALLSQQPDATEDSSAGTGGRREVDLMFLCLRPPEPEEVDMAALVAELQEQHGLRSLLLHRMKPSDSSGGFRPRLPADLPPSPADVVVDVCFMMDLTGSMGSWMDAAVAHLAGVMRELKSESKIGRINIAFVGYRDYQDQGRKVVKPFVPSTRVEEVVDFIKKESPSGGGDTPEDVISGFEAAGSLAWSGHLRFMVLVADAPAHGYAGKVGDDHASGLCPDQDRDLKSWATELAEDKRVDLLMCRLESSTTAMEDMLAGVYAGYRGAGYGCLPLECGSANFRDALLGTLSGTLLRALAPEPEVAGLQTFDGVTRSAVMATSMSSLRESATAAARRVSRGKADSHEDADTDAPTEARSDVMRLKADLEADDMAAVRLALGLPVLGDEALVAQAARALLEAGVTLADMEAQGYPPEILEAVREAGMRMLGQL